MPRKLPRMYGDPSTASTRLCESVVCRVLPTEASRPDRERVLASPPRLLFLQYDSSAAWLRHCQRAVGGNAMRSKIVVESAKAKLELPGLLSLPSLLRPSSDLSMVPFYAGGARNES